MSIFLILLGFKLYIKKYNTFLYWGVFTATAIVGTAISDFLDRTLGLGYTQGSLILITLLLIILSVWYKSEKSLNVERIYTTKAELFYWLAFLIANTLGTAAGDFLADELEIGFINSALIITVILLISLLMHYYTKISSVLLFWIAFVLSIGIGTVGASLFFATILIVALLREIQVEKRKNKIEDFSS